MKQLVRKTRMVVPLGKSVPDLEEVYFEEEEVEDAEIIAVFPEDEEDEEQEE